MTADHMTDQGTTETITRKGSLLIALWGLGVLLLYAAFGTMGTKTLHRYKTETAKARETWLQAATLDAQTPLPKAAAPPGGEPVDVTVGIAINRIEELSLDKGTWVADFDVWFRWSGGRVSPGEHFQVANGDVDLREREEAFTRGNDHYERFNVRARLSFSLAAGRFPFSDQALHIQIEDGVDSAENLRYLADERDSAVNPIGLPSGMKVTRSLSTVKAQVYESGRGDPRRRERGALVHSRFVFAVLIAPPGASLFIKLYQALFASVAISILVFFIKPTQVDPRFGLGVGAFFAAVSNNIYVRSFLPYSDRIALPDMINAIGLMTIFLTLVQSTVSLYVLDTLGRERTRRRFDHVSFVVVVGGYVLVNAALILAARS